MGETGEYVKGSYWFYAPNKGAPIVFAILFATSMTWHVWQCIRYKCWKVSGVLPWSACIFTAGFILRAIGAWNYDNLKIFIASLVLIYSAPPLYELSNYFMLSRILYYVPYHSPIHPGRVFVTFGFISSVIETLNANGAVLISNTSRPKDRQDIGKSLLKAALLLQLFVLCAFVYLAVYFHRTCRRAGQLPSNLRNVLHTLYISSFLIGARTLFRTVEYFVVSSLDFSQLADPSDASVLIRYEWYFWIFECTLMVLNTYLLNWRHPMKFLPQNVKVYLAIDGKTEVEGPGYVDKRPFWVTLVDPFDLGGLLKGGVRMQDRFWETHAEGRVVVEDGGEAERERTKKEAGRVEVV